MVSDRIYIAVKLVDDPEIGGAQMLFIANRQDRKMVKLPKIKVEKVQLKEIKKIKSFLMSFKRILIFDDTETSKLISKGLCDKDYEGFREVRNALELKWDWKEESNMTMEQACFLQFTLHICTAARRMGFNDHFPPCLCHTYFTEAIALFACLSYTQEWAKEIFSWRLKGQVLTRHNYKNFE